MPAPPERAPDQKSHYRPVNSKYKTVPCKYYHGPQGCERGEECTYIHDKEYQGRPTPAMTQMQQQKAMQQQMASYYPYYPGANPYAQQYYQPQMFVHQAPMGQVYPQPQPRPGYPYPYPGYGFPPTPSK